MLKDITIIITTVVELYTYYNIFFSHSKLKLRRSNSYIVHFNIHLFKSLIPTKVFSLYVYNNMLRIISRLTHKYCARVIMCGKVGGREFYGLIHLRSFRNSQNRHDLYDSLWRRLFIFIITFSLTTVVKLWSSTIQTHRRDTHQSLVNELQDFILL